MKLQEIKQPCQRFIDEDIVDFLDLSLWDVFKLPEEKEYQHQSLLNHFTELPFKNVRLTVAGNIRNGNDVKRALDAGIDFVTIGRSAILHHDFPKRVIENVNFEVTPILEE
jgi:2,4-dienoyl-CoA reductase-like NADH-dependent reductase (Old Yellow Enzyme family)